MPRPFLEKTSEALVSDDWSAWGEDFRTRQFENPNGQFLLVGPFSTLREGENTERLSALYGCVIKHDEIPPEDAAAPIRELFGELRQPLTQVLPVSVLACAGLLKQQSGEAFIVPNGWRSLPAVSREPCARDDRGDTNAN